VSLRRREETGFTERLTDFFVELRGGGLMLSAIDQALVRRWEEEGLPLELVCRALADAAMVHRELNPGLPTPRHLAYYAKAVDAAVRAAREKSVGKR